ncbi:MAG: hypothetical protein WC641_04910 [Patescibacteria group bacterium]
MDDQLLALCMDKRGQPKPKDECRADLINHLILEQGVDIDEAEDIAEKTLREAGFWNEPAEVPTEVGTTTE